MRAHPENYPVTKRNAWLRYSSDQDVSDYYGRHMTDSPADERARDQALAEMQRRDVRAERAAAAEERRRTRYAVSRTQRAIERERLFVEAEAATEGNMLNRRGREAKVSDRSLFTGPESRARMYASEELLNYWQDHPRPTEAYFEGRDTRSSGYGSARASDIRARMTTEEQAWRDRYDRIESAA